MTSEKSENRMEDESKDVADSENRDNIVYRKVIFEPIRIGPVSTLDEMDGKVLQFQNKKLLIKLEEHQRIEDELQQRIEQLEKRQKQDKTVMNVVNNYWQHLNTNVKNILTRYDHIFQTSFHKIKDEKIASFVRTLISCSEETFDDQKFIDVVQVSIEALSRILRNYDFVLARNEKNLAVMKAASKSHKKVDQLDKVPPFDNGEVYQQKDHPLETSGDEKLYETCIDDQDSVSDSETRDSIAKLSKPLVTENGILAVPAQNRVLDDRIVAETLDEIVDRIASQNDEDKLDLISCDSKKKVSEGVNDDGKVLTNEIEQPKKSVPDSDEFKHDIADKNGLCVTPEHELRTILDQLGTDSTKLQNLVKTFQLHYEESSMEERTIMKALEMKEQEYGEWRTKIEDIEYENEKLKCKKIKIERHLTEALEISQNIKIREANPQCRTEAALTSSRKFEELEEELELLRELAQNRCQELEVLRTKYQNTLNSLSEVEKNMNNIPDDVIENTTEYKCLQSQFSVLYNDTMHIKDQIEEYHAHVQTLNATFANKMDMTETEDLMTLRKLQADLLDMQSSNATLKREYQMLKTDFEKNLIANEQTGPLNREMRYLLVRLQKHNKHLKHEAQRYKHRYKLLNSELNAITKQNYAESKLKMESEGGSSSDFDDVDYGLEMAEDFFDGPAKDDLNIIKKEESNNIECDESRDTPASPYEQPLMGMTIKQESFDCSSPPSSPSTTRLPALRFPNPGPSRLCSTAHRKLHEYHEILTYPKEMRECTEVDDMDYENLSDDEYVQDLRSQLKKAEIEQKELKLLLDMYRGVNRDKRENMELICVEKKLKTEIEETKAQMRRILEIKRENRKKMADEDALRKIKYLEDQNYILMRQINVHKQEEEALLCEMEVTNQAFEDMQEQNSRLIQQLREKDDANSKLMAERIKSNLLYKLTREENENLQVLITATAKQLDSVTTVMNELEDKEQVYQTAINNVEKEINLRQQALDSHRKKALESAQVVSEAKVTLEKLLSEIEESKECIVDKLIVLDNETFKYNRLQEELKILRRRVERLKKLEPSEQPDIVLVEEVREYKEMLTCQSCKVRRKDAVLSKCFHVFCWECLRTRYETRQRKCPKCNATFGANDYHRLFFTN